MKKLLLAAVMTLFCVIFLLITGRTYTLEMQPYNDTELSDDAVFVTDLENDCVSIGDVSFKEGKAYVTLHSEYPGHTFITIMQDGNSAGFDRICVLPGGIIAREEFLGDCTGDTVIPIMISIYLIILLADLFRKYRAEKKRTMYSYRNVRLLALIIFLISLLIRSVFSLSNYHGFADTLDTAMRSAASFTGIALPFVLLMSIYMIFSNARLMKREGFTWRNMLGVILGVFLSFLTLLPILLSDFLQIATFVDVHNEKGIHLYIEYALEGMLSAIGAYLECVLIATIVYGIKAARHIPSCDKDYILILGCQVAADGSLTKLLQGRADRALEFAAMQKEKTGKDIVFVPSGGKGDDEIIAEADAIRNYLLETGVKEDRILSENRSVNTYENFRNSLELIREHAGGEEVKIAFSTTNYHVFRSGVLAESMGVHAEGIGAKTKTYFWINAFIREFIATLNSERSTHIKVAAALMVIMALMSAAMYVNALL